MPTSRLEIDLSAIDRNLGVIREVVSPPTTLNTPTPPSANPAKRHTPVGICAVVKQDGYGMGAARICKRLCATGVEMLSVYTLDEARTLAEAVPNVPILILMPVNGVDRMDPLYRHASIGRLHLTLHSADQLKSIIACAARIGAPMPVHVQVDTGMSRGGAAPGGAHDLVQKVLSSTKVRLAGLMTHFASPCCDEAFTREQARSFRDFVESIKPAARAFFAAQPKGAPVQDLMLHAANSCATFRSRSLHGSLVRVGQALLGFALEDSEKSSTFEFVSAAARLEPAVRWTTTVVHTLEIPAGWPVGYGGVWKAPKRADGRPSRIALLPVGYADGYARSLGGNGGDHAKPAPGVVGFTGRIWNDPRPGETGTNPNKTIYAPVVGRVSMDQITVDVTDVPERYLRPEPRPGMTETPGAEVELYSRVRGTPNYLPTLAAGAGTITHELLTRMSPRVERAYSYPARPTTEEKSSDIALIAAR